MGYIGNEPTTGHFPVDNFTSSGGSTYTLSQAPASAGAIEVSVQGILQSTTAYSISGTTLTMAGVTSGVKIFVRHLGETLVLPTPADGSVTTAKLGINSVDGTKIAMGSDAAGDILYHGATDYARLAKGTAGQALVMNSGATAPEWGEAGGGKILQIQSFPFTSTYQLAGSSTPTDTGITVNITPSATSSKIYVVAQVTWHGGGSGYGGNIYLYRGGSPTAFIADANGSAIRATHSVRFIHGWHGDEQMQSTFSYLDSPNSTSQQTYAVYVSVQSGHNIWINKDATDSTTPPRGRSTSSITVMEYGA